MAKLSLMLIALKHTFANKEMMPTLTSCVRITALMAQSLIGKRKALQMA